MRINSISSNKIWLVTLGILSLWNCVAAGSAEGQLSDGVSREKLRLFFENENISHLRLSLRRRYFDRDSNNTYVRWLLNNCCHCAVAIESLEDADLFDGSTAGMQPIYRALVSQYGSNDNNYLVVIALGDFSRFSEAFLKRVAVLVVILSENRLVTVAELHRQLCNYPVSIYSLRIYVLSEYSPDILVYDPFAYNFECLGYGTLIRFEPSLKTKEKSIRDMQGFPLRIQIFRSVYAHPILNTTTKQIIGVGGVDGDVARLLQKLLNFTMLLQDPDPNYFGERDANGSYNGAIGSILNKKIDMCLTGFFVKDYLVSDRMDFSASVYDDRLCIYVPKAKRVPPSILPILSVSYDLWIAFLFSAFICATIWWVIRLLNLHLELRTREDGAAFIRKKILFQAMRIYTDTWVVWVRVNVNRYPPFNSERVFLISLCLVSVIFGAIFESSLATVYIHPLYYRDIQTMQELDESGLHIIYKYSSMADDLFFPATSPLFARLNKKLRHLNNLNADVIAEVANYGGKASVSRYGSLIMESLRYIVSKRIWIVPECPKYYAISYVMPKNSPWADDVDHLLLKFSSAGLIEKWIMDMRTAANIRVTRTQLVDTADTFKQLTVADLQLGFYVVFIGSVLGIISLIVENVLRKRK